jgi:GntR family transcriptional regulator
VRTVTAVSRDNTLALHEQIRRSILTDIWKGMYRPGDLLPSEKELSLQFGVNRLTVRQAVHALANQGHVRPLQGRGYQVRSATLSADVLTVISTSHYLEEHGLEARTKNLGAQVVQAQPDVADALGIQRGSDVIKIVRQRFAQDVLIALDEAYYDADKFQGLLTADLDHHSLVDTLFKVFDLRVGRVATTLQAGIAGERAELLDVSPGGAVLVASTVMFDLEDRPVELGITFYHGERIKLTLTAPVDPTSWPYGAR